MRSYFFHSRRRRMTVRVASVFTLVFMAVSGGSFALADTFDELQDKKESIEKKLEQATKKKVNLEQNLKQINKSLSTTLLAIGTTQKAIRETTDVIIRKQLDIQLLNQQIDLKTEILAELVRERYFSTQIPEVAAILAEEDFSITTDATEHVAMMENRLQEMLEDIHLLQNKAVTEKVSLETLKAQHEDILDTKLDQKQDLAVAQADTVQDVAETKATIAELQKKLKKLNSDLSNLLGEDVNTDDVMKAASIAANATGVRKAFILGELTQESGLGRFTGGCYYKNTRVKDADKKAFKGIMDELGYDVNKKKISCSPGYGYGGAMGIAQFMPTTWLGYKAKISGMTGHKPPDPWNVVDGVVGMAIKLANGGATSKSGEKLAAKRYYCGGPGSPYWNNKCESYAKNVLSLAAGYENN